MRRFDGLPSNLALVALLVGASLLLGGCAKRGLPPGGPEDRDAPYVESMSPASGSVGVDDTSPIAITFSEPMKRRTVETAVIVSPACQWAERFWDGTTYVLVPAQRLLSETTYLISVGRAAQDRHSVKMAGTYLGGFSTGETIEAGVIAGRVSWRSMSVEQAIVAAFDAAEATDLVGFPRIAPLYVTFSGAGGKYEIPYVDPRKTFRVLAFMDKDANGEYDEEEVVGCAGGEVALGDSGRVEGVDIVLCGSGLKGTLAGTVGGLPEPDTTMDAKDLKVVVWARSIGDTASYHTVCDRQGSFRIECMDPGRYVVEAFCDVNSNQRRDSEDTLWVELPDTLSIVPCVVARMGVTLEQGGGP
jgi:hypothetical protein